MGSWTCFVHCKYLTKTFLQNFFSVAQPSSSCARTISDLYIILSLADLVSLEHTHQDLFYRNWPSLAFLQMPHPSYPLDDLYADSLYREHWSHVSGISRTFGLFTERACPAAWVFGQRVQRLSDGFLFVRFSIQPVCTDRKYDMELSVLFLCFIWFPVCIQDLHKRDDTDMLQWWEMLDESNSHV